MKMKKFLNLALVLALAMLTFASCSGSGGVLGGSSKLSGEDLYTKLDYAISSPNNVESDDLPGTITFTAMIISDPTEITLDDEKTPRLYQEACISRNADDTFLIEVTGIAEADRPAIDAIVSVTGELNGSVYWTENGERVELLDVKASKISVIPENTAEPSSDPNITIGSVKYTFKGAHFSTDIIAKVIVVYFDFANNGSDDANPDLSKFFVFQGDGLIDSRGINVEGTDPNALAANGVGSTTETYAGKTSLYYMAFRTSDEPGDDPNTVYICMYDDDFHQTAEIAIPIAESFDAMKAQ